MALVINTNLASLIVQRHLETSSRAVETALERLSSGLRINHAADDPVGLVMADRLGADVRLANQAIRNANDALSALGIGDQALGSMHDVLTRMAELASQSASDLVTDAERAILQQEFAGLLAHADAIAGSTSFNGNALLAGSATFHVQVGLDGSAASQLSFTAVDATASALGIASLSVGTQANAAAAIDPLRAALGSVSASRGTFGAAEGRVLVALSHLRASVESFSTAESRIRDADVAAETARLTRASILQQAGVAILAQANQLPAIALTLLR